MTSATSATPLPQGAPLPSVVPLSKSGTKTWGDIVNSINPFSSNAPTPAVTGYDKKGNPVHDPNISGYDTAGKPYYTFPSKGQNGDPTLPLDTPDAAPLVPDTPTDTPVDTSPALAPSAVDNWNPG